MLFLLAFRFVLDITSIPSAIASKVSGGPVKAITGGAEGGAGDAGAAAAAAGTGGKKKKKGPSPLERFPPSKCDEILHRFLAIVDPEHSKLIPTPAPSDVPKPLPLSDWKTVSSEESVSVLAHPSIKALYAISAHLPDVPLKKLFGLLVDIEARPNWDKICESSEHIEDVRDGSGRVASCSYLKMMGMWPVKVRSQASSEPSCHSRADSFPRLPQPKDLVLLSVITRLPPSPSRVPQSGDENVMRMVCATSSVEHPSKPPQPGCQRMELKISGFLAESDGKDGSRIVQITDLSGLGSVPGFIINTVTGKLIPASLRRVGKLAKTHKSARFGDDAKDEEWIPPVVGDWQEGKDPKGPSNEATGDAEGDDADPDDALLADVPPSQARNLHALLGQLRFITTRLSAMEGAKADKSSSAGGGKRAWIGNALSKLVGRAGGADAGAGGLGLATQPNVGLAELGLSVAGGVAGAATFFWLASEWTQRRRVA